MLFVPQKQPSFTLPKHYCLKSWFYPGLWLSDAELDSLRKTIESFTLSKLAMLPAYGVYLPSRAPYSNRIISVVYDDINNEPAGFAAMTRFDLQIGADKHTVIHLGLVIIGASRLGRDLLFLMYFRPLMHLLLSRKGRPFWITSVSMEPSIIGAVSDNFSGVFPHYSNNTRPSPVGRELALALVREYSHEFGMDRQAEFDPQSFVIRGSCRGPSEALRADYRHSAKYRIHRCNKFCERALDYERGDELLQVGRASVGAGFSIAARLVKTQVARGLGAIRRRILP